MKSINLDDFETHVIQASYDKPVLLDLWAQWCPPCLVLAPILDRVAQQYSQSVDFLKMDVDEEDNMKIAGRYQVRGFPTVLLIRDGEEKERFYSSKPETFITDFIERWL
ncbi:MAG: thioredoxin family protein [Gammaproteobacteria bacterium]|nr:thioredoxin family protein [Gammaproteobacteria bacterium]MDH5800985.1 thioredoxin family protein [Gammaproteobacteria bacterium]